MQKAIAALTTRLTAARREAAAQTLASGTLFLAGYGLAGLMFDLASVVS